MLNQKQTIITQLLSVLCCVFVLMLSACSHTNVMVHDLEDNKMTCAAIITENKKIHVMLEDIKSKTGVSARNVGMALLFWPGIMVNEINGKQAETLAHDRLGVLAELYKQQNCDEN